MFRFIVQTRRGGWVFESKWRTADSAEIRRTYLSHRGDIARVVTIGLAR